MQKKDLNQKQLSILNLDHLLHQFPKLEAVMILQAQIYINLIHSNVKLAQKYFGLMMR